MEQAILVECPRDAWQGLPNIIPTDRKVEYLKLLIKSGFRHLDAVSFVSPKSVPQMADSEAVMAALAQNATLAGNSVEIIGIVVNERGFNRALSIQGVATIGYPYSLSERFGRQNANISQQQSRTLVEKMRRDLESIECEAVTHAPGAKTPKLIVYISMAFGNPYGETWSSDTVVETVAWLKQVGVTTVSLADTVGRASPTEVAAVFRAAAGAADGIELGVHLHSRYADASEKIAAAFESGCRRFDGALTGLGGCPFAGDDLVGNIPTEVIVKTLSAKGCLTGIEDSSLEAALNATRELRRAYWR
jgi:hydroxymethylglutaryl-CoA lyase